ncbi:hypothetical protein GYMLUDRAFT_246593 [Collybiopsis luxurians FD-317 M1]|uniref:Uncharacterized protein n=1 Tax=Collybiopsis luxurians FD-317 M1 TaxID=944289 RepID=A0A0D0C5Y4_9AGAR|nr:hypothetical protein GYMLUDRAFT_246593 [Collybiopsis luxurians FD-317 M1]
MQTRSVNASKLNQLIQNQLEKADRYKGKLIPPANKLAPRIVHRSIDYTGKMTESDLSDEPIDEVASLVLTDAASSPSFYWTLVKPIMDRFLENLTERSLEAIYGVLIEWRQSFCQRELVELHLSSADPPPSFETLRGYLQELTPLIVLNDNIEPGG